MAPGMTLQQGPILLGLSYSVEYGTYHYNYVGIVHISMHLKEELAWATDKWLRIISNIMLFETVIPLSN